MGDIAMAPYGSEALRGFPHLIVGYEQVLPREVSDEVFRALIQHHLGCVSPAGMEIAGQRIADLSGTNLSDLCLHDPDVRDLKGHDRYHINQCLAFFKKRADIDLNIDKEAAAVASFFAAEAACRLTNACFLAHSQGRFQFHPDVEGVLHSAQRKISSVLGDAPALTDLRPRFGPGATTQVQKRNACLVTKLEQVPACSTNLEPFAGVLLATLGWGDNQCEFEVEVPIHLCRLDFVPKNVKTFRAIMTQPALNSMFQAGVGDVISARIKRVGLDIHDQSKNQHWAWLGSITGLCATLDLSSASDTIATRLVQHLLPTDWFELLATLRCSEAMYDGRILTLEQFSSMGNGFTFPLETLIFWAISESVKEMKDARSIVPVTVYGDDIIVPNDVAIPLMRVLRDLGFTPNDSKSFWYGDFRESCGADYVSGFDVRPWFLDDAPTGADFFKLHNFYVARGNFVAARFVESLIHPSIRLRGPSEYGDGHLHSPFWISRPVQGKKGWCGYSFETWSSRPQKLHDSIIKAFVQKVNRNGTLLWRRKHETLMRRVATYTAYCGEIATADTDSRERDDFGAFVTPGSLGVTRTKIYIFTTSMLTKHVSRVQPKPILLTEREALPA